MSTPHLPRAPSTSLPNPIPPSEHHSGPLGIPLGEFRTLCTIGKGGYGKVKLATEIQGEEEEKEVMPRRSKRKRTSLEERIHREVKLTCLLRHPHIVSLLDFRMDRSKYYLFYEYIEGRSLSDRVGTRGLKEGQVRKYAAQLASALAFCHAHSVVHRDVKVENILVDKQDNIFLIDFGLASFYCQDSLLHTSCGSVPYSSPEILRGVPYVGKFVDVWSFGICIFVLLTGSFPFGDPGEKGQYEVLKRGRFPLDQRLSKSKPLFSHPYLLYFLHPLLIINLHSSTWTSGHPSPL
ncbi:MAG: kinase-like domain-containing protein [Piptocephalis tieghemiana]|nr:MAG: kinase-like domain-containing protein [Piptocephalis tieghemiana]